MPHSRFFAEEIFVRGKEITLIDEEFHHIKVMRKRSEDLVELINGKNQLSIAKIICIKDKKVSLKIIEVVEKKPSNPKIILALALLRGSKMDLILEKCTELGVDEFILFKADGCETTHIPSQREKRIASILISAIKQCGRLDLPKISYLSEIKLFLKMDYQYFLGDLEYSTTIDITNLKKSSKPLCVLIGPEKGFSEKEIAFLKNSLQALPFRINENILRSETAAISSIGILSQTRL